MKKNIIIILAVIVTVICSIAFAEETVYGNKINGDILFNNLAWGKSRDDVFSFLKDKFNDVVEECNEYEYGKIKQVVCTYTNNNKYSMGKVGDMEIDEIVVWYINEEGKYNNSMFFAQYKSEDNSTFLSMVEMLEYKYGSPYSSYKDYSSGRNYKGEVDRFIWKNQNETQELTITRENTVADIGAMLGLGSSIEHTRTTTIHYSNEEIWSYLKNHRELFEAQQKEDELENKDYDGL